MARNVKFSFLRGGGSSLEVLYGKVSLTPTNLHTLSSTAVLPAPTTFDLVNGTALATNVAPTPTPVDGTIAWAYKVKITDNYSKTWEYLVGVPDGTTEINFNVLPRYSETRPPAFGTGPAGPAGTAATIAIGTTSSGASPAVSNTGTSKDAVLNFTLQQGPQGPVGIGVPAGGTALQVVRKNVGNTATEWATLDKALVGLGNVDNTSDANKPASTPQKTYIDSQISLTSLNKNVEGAPLYSYGHSWAMPSNPHCTTGTGEYQVRLKNRLQLGALAQNGLSGAYMLDMAAGVLAPSTAGKDRRFPIGGKGIVTLQCLVNDIVGGNALPLDPKWLGFYQDNLTTFLAAVSAGKFQDASTGVYAGGAWVDIGAGTAAWYPAGKLKYIDRAVALGSTAKWDVSGDVAWVNTVSVASTASALNGGKWTARVGSTVVGTFDPRGRKPDTVVTGTRGSWADSPIAVKLSGLNDAAGTTGTKTVTITCDEAKDSYVAGVMEPAANPPKVFVVLEAPRNPAASNVAQWNTYYATYRQAIIDTCAQFSDVAVVDIAPEWQNPSFISSKDTAKAHPNDLGMIHIADKLETVIRSTITSPDAGVMVL